MWNWDYFEFQQTEVTYEEINKSAYGVARLGWRERALLFAGLTHSVTG